MEINADFILSNVKHRLNVILMLNKAILGRESQSTVYADITNSIKHIGNKNNLFCLKLLLCYFKGTLIFKICFAYPLNIIFVKLQKRILNNAVIHQIKKITSRNRCVKPLFFICLSKQPSTVQSFFHNSYPFTENIL